MDTGSDAAVWYQSNHSDALLTTPVLICSPKGFFYLSVLHWFGSVNENDHFQLNRKNRMAIAAIE